MNDEDILRVWGTIPVADRNKVTVARVFACALSAYENGGEIVTSRALAVMRLFWLGKVYMGSVPSEVRGTHSDPRVSRDRQAEFQRLTLWIQTELSKK